MTTTTATRKRKTAHSAATDRVDLSIAAEPWERRNEAGKAVREAVPRERHGEWSPRKNRPDPVKIVTDENRGRQEELVPLRMARMAVSPFSFLRGAAAVMAFDLARTPVIGHHVVIDGDAHINNFGFYGTPQRDVVFDLNDFDESTIGPWEFDLKRLTASVNVAARENGLNRRERRSAVMRSVEAYRWNASRLQSMGVLDVWYLHAYPGRQNPLTKVDSKTMAIVSKSLAKAQQQTNSTLLTKIAQRTINGAWRFKEDPPVLTRVDARTAEAVIGGLNTYLESLPRERRILLRRYNVADVAHRVVGVGSVGVRAYLVLLFGSGDQDPLFLQVKEATAPALGRYVPKLPAEYAHQGRRVVLGTRALQASSDILLGWTTIHGRPYFVRQMKNMKGGLPVEFLVGEQFNFYAWACGTILARAHARTGDVAVIAGYCGNTPVLDRALADWAEAYGDQTVQDHAALVEAIQSERVRAAAQP